MSKAHVVTPAVDRVLRRCIESETGCWLWQGKPRPDGYFQVWQPDGTQPPGHRVVYEHFRGEVPEGLVLDHLCFTRNCVNPWHLDPVTQYINVHRSDSPWALNARKSHCKQGHEFTADNTYLMPNTGHRACRECRRAAERRWRARKNGVAA